MKATLGIWLLGINKGESLVWLWHTFRRFHIISLSEDRKQMKGDRAREGERK